MVYTTKHVATIYNITVETVRNWSIEFAEYLSNLTRPGKNKNRLFNVSDLEVLSLVAQMKDQGRTYGDIHATLKIGQRGSAPDLPPEELQLIASTENELQLALQVELLQQMLTQTKADLLAAERRAGEAQALREEKARLEGTLTEKTRELDETKTELRRARDSIEALSRRLGDEYVRGVMETLERKGDLPKREGE